MVVLMPIEESPWHIGWDFLLPPHRHPVIPAIRQKIPFALSPTRANVFALVGKGRDGTVALGSYTTVMHSDRAGQDGTVSERAPAEMARTNED